jgi:hypothetical protein
VRPGDIVQDRFEIVARAGAGGMGVVYRALDRLTASAVALKVVHDPDGEKDKRFDREIRLLAQLIHPAIVRYVSHGTTAGGEPFLAMEWLEGEDLAAHLVRTGLDPAETVVVARRIAEGLAAAHAVGALHRDLKPSNVFLSRGEPSTAKLLDFGVAHLSHATRVMTQTGAMIGSLGYMAPEQIRGDKDIDARADLYSLGCVMFEALAGRRAFEGDHPVTILVQALHDRPPLLAELRPELPEALTGLVDRMLARKAEARPSSAREVIEALDALGSLAGARAPQPLSRPSTSISGGERRLVSVILVRSVGVTATALSRAELATVASDSNAPVAAIRKVVGPLGGDVVSLRHGTSLVLLRGLSNAKDEAGRAAACALAIASEVPDVRVAVATGAAEVTGRWAAGPVVDRAAALLDRTRLGSTSSAVRIDDVTEGLLDVRFVVESVGPGDSVLRGVEAFAGDVRRVLGKPTPCVGRERELAFLESTCLEAVADEVARAVLVLGVAGVGKSRLRREITGRLAARSEARVLVSRCDALYSGSPLRALADLLRNAAEVREDQPPEERYEALERHVTKVVPEGGRAETLEFLAELLRAPAAGEPSPRLRAARNDPRIMAEQTRVAFETWIRSLLDEKPLVLVLEDLHWSDAPSFAMLEGWLARFAEKPLVILGLARPEIRDTFPEGLRGASEVRLEGLTRKAAERLVRSLLGDDTPLATITRVVERAGGNAFYLEELVRHVASQAASGVATGDLPETVLAMAQSRLDALEPEARRVLRVGAIFGETFWRRAVVLLLGGTMGEAAISEWLDALVTREVLERGRNERFADEVEYVFRHALLRDAAYSMLVDDDRQKGHRVAGDWLIGVGERDPRLLAEHYLRGAAPDKAAPQLLLAARAALAASDLEGAAKDAERGLACEPSDGKLRGALSLARAMPLGWKTDWVATAPLVKDALTLLPTDSREWSEAAALEILRAAAAGNPAGMFELMSRIQGAAVAPAATGPYAFTIFMLSIAFSQLGQRAIAIGLEERLASAAERLPEGGDPAFEGWRHIVATVVADKPRLDHLGIAVRSAERGLACLVDAGDLLGQGVAGGWLARTLSLAGDQTRGEERARATLALIERTRNEFTRKRTEGTLGSILVAKGAHDEAIGVLTPLTEGNDTMAQLFARVELARAHLGKGDAAAALAQAEATALAAGLFFAPHQAAALAVQASAQRLLGKADEALATAQKGIKLGETSGMDVLTSSVLRREELEALAAKGDASLAERAAAAKARLETIASDLTPELAATFRAIEPNARTIALAG